MIQDINVPVGFKASVDKIGYLSTNTILFIKTRRFDNYNLKGDQYYCQLQLDRVKYQAG